MNWYNDEELWQVFYDCMFDEESFKLAEQQISQVLALVEHKVDTVLDLACGPGRHCLSFAKMGMKVIGVDSSEFLLRKAKEKSDQQKLRVTFVHDNMLDYVSERKVDLIVNMFNSFGYFDTQEENQQLINNVFANLSETGTLIIDTVGKETLARTIEPVHLTEYENGDLRIERPLLIDDMQVFSNEWIYISGEKVYRKNYQHFVYTPMELKTMCFQAGFNEVDVYGSLDAEPYDLESERLVIVAKKY